MSILISIVANAYDFEVGGIYFNKDGNYAIVTSGNSYYSGDVSIPSTVNYGGMEYSVTSIGDEAFRGCSSLTSVTIPNSVTSIGNWAFYQCMGLTSVTIPNSVTSVGVHAFGGCSGLTSIKVESGNTIYDSRNNCNAIIETASNTLVAGCKNTVIPNSVTSIGDSAFMDCSGLTSVTIPNSVTSIGYEAFYYCSGLTSVTIGNSVTYIGDGAFSNCHSLTSVTIPNSVTSIGDYAFSHCTGLTSVTIPNSVTSIGVHAFGGCSGLTSVTIPNSVTSIGDYAFSNCHSLTSVTIPNSVTSIGEYAFYDCSGLTSVTIPNSVTSIGNSAFAYCSNLKSVISEIEIPFTIDSSVFDSDTENYGQLTVPKGKKSVYQSTNGWKEFSNIVEEGISSYTLTIQSSSGGYVSYNGANISATTKTFTLDEGSSVTLTLTPNSSYYLSKLTVNGTDVTSNVSNNQYTISNITANTSVVVTFEQILATGIEVNATNFPDENFRTYIIEMVEGADDAILTDEEIAKVTDIDCSAPPEDLKIHSLKGIEFFSALERLLCADNRLTSLDVSKNPALTSLYCSNNLLTSLDVSKNPVLTSLACFNNQLTSLDVSNTALTILDCGLNQLTSLDVSKNTALTSLDCGSNQLTKLDVSNNTALTNLYCNNNLLTTLSVSNYIALRELCCSSNRLTTLSVSVKTLYFLDCSSNQLTTLDVSYISSLQRLNCSSNQLTTLDVSENTELTNLNCSNNQLASLDLSKNSSINFSSIGRQSKSLKAVSTSAGIAIPVPSDFDFTKVSNLKLDGASVSGSLTTVDGQKYLVFAQTGAAQSSIDGKQLTYDYSTGNSFSDAASMDVTVSLSYTATTPTGIEVNATNFPDEAFRNWVLQNVSGASDGILTDEEIANVTSINCSGTNGNLGTIANLQGIEFFTAMTRLRCSYNKLTSLDVSKNTALTELFCGDNQLTSLDLSKNIALIELHCGSNQLTSLDVSYNTAIEILYCFSNHLTSLDVSKNTKLTSLSCNSNQLTSLDLSKNIALTSLHCSSNLLTSLDISKNIALTNLECWDNQLTSLDVSKNTALSSLLCHSNQLTNLDLSKNSSFFSAGIGAQSISLKAVSANAGIAIPVPSDFNFTKVSNLKLNGTSVNGSITTVTDQKYLVFAQPGTAQTAIDGKKLTYAYYTDNSLNNEPLSMDVTVTLSYTPTSYSLSIQSGAGGSVSYDGTTVTNTTRSFTVAEGTSATITISPYSGYRLNRLTVNGTNVTSSVSNNQYTISNITANTTVVVAFKQIPVTTYSLSLQSGSGGSISYNGTFIENTIRTFTVNEGTSVTLAVTPDVGYQLASLIVDGTDVTSRVSNNSYTISNITANTTVEATFAVITYNLTIRATGNGTVSYDGSTIRGTTRTLSVEYGTSAKLIFSADEGYQLASLIVGGNDVTSRVSGGTYTINDITANTSVIVVFEKIPVTTYSLSIQSTAGGSVSYSGTTIVDATQTFSLSEGASATLVITPDKGYLLSSLTVNGTDVTSQVTNGSYTIGNISSNTTVVATFEQIPIITYSLTIQSGEGGHVFYNGTDITSGTKTFTVEEGTQIILTITPDSYYKIGKLTVNDQDMTVSIINNQYTIQSFLANTTINVTFEASAKSVTFGDITYEIESMADHTLRVDKGFYSGYVVIPATISDGDITWTVTGINEKVFTNAITAISWEIETEIPSTAFETINPNMLLYVRQKSLAPKEVQNVVVNGYADKILLVDAESGNDFYCPVEFRATEISYTHSYTMTSGLGECQGWETIALPFDVQSFQYGSKELAPFKVYQDYSSYLPFWLYELTASGFEETGQIKANHPYIISMPNNSYYLSSYNINGDVTFSANSATIHETKDVSVQYKDCTLTSCFSTKAKSDAILAMNAQNALSSETWYYPAGSIFLSNLRTVHPFEAYMTSEEAGAKMIPIFEGMTTPIREIPLRDDALDVVKIFNLQGQLVKFERSPMGEALKGLAQGVYIVNGKKISVK